MNGGFGDVDDGWAQFEADNPSWLACGVDAVERCLALGRFTTEQVWRAWRGPRPAEPRRMAEVMAEATRVGLVRQAGVTAGHRRQAGHAGFGTVYEAANGGSGPVTG